MLQRISKCASLKSAKDNKNLSIDFCQDHCKFRQSGSFWNSMSDFICCSQIMPGFSETRKWLPWNSLLNCFLQTSTLRIRSKLLTQKNSFVQIFVRSELFTQLSAGTRRTWIYGRVLPSCVLTRPFLLTKHFHIKDIVLCAVGRHLHD